jgi:hypothetical protein
MFDMTQQEQAFGSVWLLANVPWYFIVPCVIGLSTGMVLLIRWLTEYEFYDNALSSMPGDSFLAVYCGFIGWICQHDLPQGLHMKPMWHVDIFAVAIIIAISLHVLAIARGGASRSWTMLPTQWYHNLVVLPLLLYAILSTLPILWNGNYVWPQLSALNCLFAWGGLFVWDIANGNLVQK